ncbi:MAG: diguanylate cyclase [Gammaproteobacteria bacterium]|jgi:diguanylate cyclase (GGDEF)-like protein|nr:diguanylate cyclase [Gammaproteobacteria bacterium]
MVHTILLVEDEWMYRNAVKRALKDGGHRFLEADGGRTALELVGSNAVDLILLDLVMPDMDGFAFLKEFRLNADWQRIPVCVMTAWADGVKRRKAIDLGADDFVGKPVDNIELETRIKSLLRLSQYQQQLSDLNAELEAQVKQRTSYLEAALEELEQAWEQSTRDALTGVFNRRFMWEWLLPQLRQAAREQIPLACLMMDVDGFKHINDSYGHGVGDEILNGFTRIAAKCVRGSDIIVRYGGDEFVALLPKCNLEGGRAVAERVRQDVMSSQLSSLKIGDVTCSIGVALYDPEDPLTGTELLKHADRALYDAKDAGRNCVAVLERPIRDDK